jgi:sugar lactone lactonase YvrE
VHPNPLNCLLFLAALSCGPGGAVASAGAPSPSPQIDAEGRRILSESVRLSGAGSAASLVVRMTLTDEESAAPMPISITLRMRDFAGLQARIAAGEQIPWPEMEARYRPLRSDYDAVARWLATQGFEETLLDSTHTNLFVRAAVARVGQAFGVQMARISAADGEYTAAVTAPRVPAEIADCILGVNGLQPQLRLRHVWSGLANAQTSPADLVGGTAYVTPKNIAAAYHFPSTLDGTGQTIAVLNEASVQMADLTAFWTASGVAQDVSRVTVVGANENPPSFLGIGDMIESVGDLEWAGALAPGARIRQYLGGDAFESFAAVVNDLPGDTTISVASISYSSPEAGLSLGYMQSISQYLAQLAAAGVTVLADSGDGGSNTLTGAGGSYLAAAPLDVEFPGCDPDATSVGGTQLDFDSNWNVSGESVWSDLTTTQSASGGGVSTFFQKPPWQNGGAVLAAQAMRCVPDITAISFGFLTSGVALGDGTVKTGEITSFAVFNGQNIGFAGTSEATPIWAAAVAVINQARAAAGHGPIGLLGPNIYPLAGTTSFTDITSGSNGAYSAGPGFDLCSGLGSPNVANLASALSDVATPTSFYLPAAPTVASSVQAPAAPVTGGGSVTMSVGGVASNFGPVTYQWTLNGTEIPGATGASYTIASARGNDQGAYAVLVQNAAGTLTFAMGTLTVLAPTVTLTAPAPSAVAPGNSVTMAVSAKSSGGALAYQWYFNGVVIPGAVQASLELPDTTAGNAGDFSVNVTDSNGLTVVDAGYLTLQGPNYLTPYSFTTAAAPALGVHAVAVDSAGNLYLGDNVQNTIQKVEPGGAPSLLAGIPGVAGSTDGPGTSATFNTPTGVAVDSAGNVYVADTGNSTIRMISPSGTVTTLAGTAGTLGSTDGTGPAALFFNPFGVSVDSNGIVYVADTNNSTIRVIRPGGVVTTLAGTARSSASTDGVGPAALFRVPEGVAVDAIGNVYVADTGNATIRKIAPGGRVTTLAGNPGPPGPQIQTVTGSADGTGKAALFNSPTGLAVDIEGNIYVADTDNGTIRVVTPSDVVSTLAGVPGTLGSADGTGGAALFNNPRGIAVNANGILYVADNTIRVGILAAAAPPSVEIQPIPQTVASGSTATFGVVAIGPATYQWYQDGAVIAGATYSTLVLHALTAADDGIYTCTLTNSQGSVTTAPALLTVVGTADPGRLVNLSCRAQVGTGPNVLIAGFAVGGPGAIGSEPVLVRASGPALAPLGVPGVLPDPRLELHNSSATVGTNSGWMGTSSLRALFSQVGAFQWTDPASLDSALSENLPGGAYSAVVSGATGDTGVALVEIYDATPPGGYSPASSRLVNLSARVQAGTGGNVLIAGFVIGGSTAETVLVRASGPALAPFGVSPALPDPEIKLNKGTETIAVNTGWGADPQIAAAAASVGAFSWGSLPTPDSALLLTLPPGSYTAEVAGASGDTGIALVEVYEVP